MEGCAMDPDVCWSELLEMAQSVVEEAGAEKPTHGVDVLDLADRLLALDDWLARGGFPPKAFRAAHEGGA